MRLGRWQAHGRAQQQDAGGAAPDSGLGQRHVHRREAHPDQRQQQPIGDKAYDGGETLPRRDDPAGDGQHQHGQNGVEREDRHSCAGPSAQRRTGNELCHRRSGQLGEQPDDDELERVERPRRQRQQPQHDQPEAEIVRFGERVKAGERVGEAQQPDRAGQEEEGTGRRRRRC